MKIKIIHAYGPESLQNEVNNWLKNFKGHIVNISMATLKANLAFNFYMTILYEDYMAFTK